MPLVPSKPYKKSRGSMKLLIDTEGFLVPAAKSAEYDIEWQPGDWQSYRSRLEAAVAQLAKLEELAPRSQKSRIRKDRRTLERLVAA
jgi:hypothetical protein